MDLADVLLIAGLWLLCALVVIACRRTFGDGSHPDFDNVDYLIDDQD